MAHLLAPLLALVLAPASERANYEEAQAQLSDAVANATSVAHDEALAALEAALEEVSGYPGEATAELPETELRAMVILVRLHLAEGDDAQARAAMDALIRRDPNQRAPVQSFGRAVAELHAERLAALEKSGRGTLVVECEVACEIVLEGRRLEGREQPLLLGTYALWVRAQGSELPWERREVSLEQADAVAEVRYEDPLAGQKPEHVEAPSEPLDRGEKPKRLLPRGVEIAGLAAGVGMVVAGAVLLSFDGKCSVTKEPPTDDSTADSCGNIYESTVAGATLLGVGGGVLFVSGLTLAVDEVRVGRARGRQVSLGLTLRF
ncbi:hypothetical protein G6O69_04145 [Pseudenhygromyxa sp. WMMC2535]|uniref:hypothetical protein n=1 Tax=Pseudenhygromyxa sp. WMMC2535 TaxID=2712867 RepID=UPI00159599C8|nr:hypothetical protein [Pseudenhygromyxa sp. WMMC2535]NVB37008.1 hypothetical protein [Pseudenhygromyxa sp. WMMC2535]